MPITNDNYIKCTHEANYFSQIDAWRIERTCDGDYGLQMIKTIFVYNATNDTIITLISVPH